MRRSAFIFFVATLFFSLSSLVIAGIALSGTDDVRRITKEDLKSLLNDPNTTVIDVRQEGDWQESNLKIKGAIREKPIGEKESWTRKYSKEKNIVLYCA